MTDATLLQKILIPSLVLIPFILWFWTYLIYRKYFIKKQALGEVVNDDVFGSEDGGQMIGDGFGMRPPIPIVDNTINLEIQLLIKKYNNLVKFFWIWSVFGTVILIVILNLTD